MLDQLRYLFKLSRAHKIARRYFVTNGFDGALTILGLNMGFYTSGTVAMPVILSADLGAAIALAVSGFVSAYMSESAEREQELKELEQAVVADLGNTAHGHAARLVPILIALVNGIAPLILALLIMLPLWLSQTEMVLPLAPLELSILIAFLVLFLMGVFLGVMSNRFWLWSGLKMLVIALLTAGMILFIGN